MGVVLGNTQLLISLPQKNVSQVYFLIYLMISAINLQL